MKEIKHVIVVNDGFLKSLTVLPNYDVLILTTNDVADAELFDARTNFETLKGLIRRATRNPFIEVLDWVVYK